MNLEGILRGRERPVVVQFHARWCGPCRILSPRVEKIGKEFDGVVDVVRVDVDEAPELAAEAGVRGVPALVVYGNGAEIRRHAGVLDDSGLRTLFRSGVDPSLAAVRAGVPGWHMAAKLAAAVAALVLAESVPALGWLRWPGYGLLAWAMSGLCPSCSAPSSSARPKG